MKTETSLKKSGRWTSYIERLVRIFRRALIEELGEEPKGSKKVALDLLCERYGVMIVMSREIRRRELIAANGELIGLLSKQYLGWLSSFERSLNVLIDGKADNLPIDLPGIPDKFRSRNGIETN